MATVQARRLVPSINRTRSPIAVLADRSSGERDTRIDDFLNDKLQTITDFKDLDSLIASVDIQRLQLQDQLEGARPKLQEAREATKAHTNIILLQSQVFRTQQSSIDKQLATIAASNTPNDTAQKLKGPMEKLRKLELAEAYVKLLKEVNDLTAEARCHLPNDPKEALKPYTRLKQLSISLRQLQGPAEGAGVHIVKYVDDRAISLWGEMKKIMSDEFETVLKKNHWPTSPDIWSREWSDCFEKLLDLQAPELLSARGFGILLPMAVLTKTFVQQFKYHFMSERPTNSLHSPDYFLEWTIGTISKWQDFLRENIGPILVAHFRGSRLAGNGLCIDPVSAFITVLLPVLREKVSGLLITLSGEPQLFSNFILLLMKFDKSMRNEFNYDGGDPVNGWKGLTTEVLDVWIDKWLYIEKEFARARYEDIINSSDNGQIDFDSAGPGRTKQSYGALKIMNLLQNVTSLYEPLRSFPNKLRFLIDIQLAILDKYHNRLSDSLDAYQAITSAVGRTLHGVTKEQQAALEGTGGLESLCKVYGSAEHVILTLHGWGNSLFFVDLWNELQKKAKKRDIDDNMTGQMSYSEVRNSTLASMGSDADGGLFDETISAYKKNCRDRAEYLMIDAIKHDFLRALRPYINKTQWLAIDDESDAVINPFSLNISAELNGPLQTLTDNMKFLHKALGVAPFRRIWHEALNTLQELLWNDIFMRERFTTLGAAQFFRDLTALWAVIDKYVVDGSASALGMPKLREAATLLNLSTVSGDDVMSLRSAYERVFSGNAEAKKVVDELGFSTITYQEARKILQRRVEASE